MNHCTCTMEILSQCQHCLLMKFLWSSLLDHAWKNNHCTCLDGSLQPMETFKPVPALLYSWRIHDHSRLTISPLKPRQIFNVFSIHPDAHWTTTTTPQLQMRWWLPWTHGQPEMRWWLPWTHGQPQMRWWLPWTEMLETWNLDPLMWTRIPQQQRKNPSKPRLFFTFKNHWNKELQYNYKTVH